MGLPTSGRPLASVVVPTWNGAHLLEPCLASLERQSYPSLEVIVADGASTDGTAEVLRRFPRVVHQRVARNRGFAGNVNAGLRVAQGEVLLLLNNDAEADRDWVLACVDALAAHPEAGSVAARLLFADGATVNSAGDAVTRSGWARQRGAGEPDGSRWRQPGWVFGASGGGAAYRRALFADVGLFDERFFMYLEDVDLAFRAQLRRWRCWYQPAALVHHRGSASGGGPMASFYNGRNLVWLLAKNLPSGLLPRLGSGILARQWQRAADALSAWRGAAARATLRGQLAGALTIPSCLSARAAIQARRRLSDADVLQLLEADGDR